MGACTFNDNVQARGMDLTDEQWAKMESVLLPDPVRADGRGRPWSDRRKVMNGILWILRTGAPWKDLPARYGSYQTVHRRFQSWARSKQLEYLLWLLAEDLRERGGIDVRECFVDGTFVPAKKGGPGLGSPSGARAAKSWVSATLLVFHSPYAQGALARRK